VSAADAKHFRLSPSRRFALLIVAAHGAAGGALIAVTPDAVLAWGLAALLGLLGIAAARDRALLRGTAAIRGFALEDSEHMMLELAHGRRLRARVGARRWVSARIVILTLALPRRRTLLVTGDMLAPEAFRRLRLWALWGQLPGVASMPREPAST
jgi:hypothetical protein